MSATLTSAISKVVTPSTASAARRSTSSLPRWATVDPMAMGSSDPHHVPNLVNGKWNTTATSIMSIPNPMHKNSKPIFTLTDTQVNELEPFVQSLKSVPKSGVHNPLKNVERYLYLGDVSRKAGEELLKPEVSEFFVQAIQRCVPKSHAQAFGEVKVTASFLLNFSSDNVRFLARGFNNPGDHPGQYSTGYRWPYGPVAIICPFNFPLEIPVLQLMGALFMGNKPVLKPAEKCAVVMEQFLHLLHAAGLDPSDVDFINGRGPVVEELILKAPVRLTQFTGSSRIGEHLSEKTRGKVKVEDAGFDWKILGPDVENVEYIAYQCDQDAYASSGQKCSAQSILFAHENYVEVGLFDKIASLAQKRTMDDLTVGPVLTHTTEDILGHVDALLKIPGSRLVTGGKELTNHDVPSIYGAVEPTAVYVPLEEMMKDENFDLCTREIFAPFQVLTSYTDSSLSLVIEACERMSHHLTAAVVSNDVRFQHTVLSQTVNGTTYVGQRARTTGAPQNHWFGPCGDTRGAGIGTPEAIRLVWSCHREIVTDQLIPDGWTPPKAS